MTLAPICAPSDPPRVLITVFIPVATAVSSGGTASTIRLASEAKAKPMPIPIRAVAT
jgi:hypothetical protein